MENFLRAYLPEEIVMSILYKYKAIQNPMAKELNKHFKRCEVLLDHRWEDWEYDERPEIGDVDAMNMLDMVVGISQDYDEWIEGHNRMDELKIEALNAHHRGTNGVDRMTFILMERNIMNRYRGDERRAEKIMINVEQVE